MAVTRQARTVSSQAMRDSAMRVSLRLVARAAAPAFADTLATRVRERESQIVLGLDPDPMRLWPLAVDPPAADGSPGQLTANAVLAHCRAVIAAAGPACVAAKPQLACFERLGAPGIAALVAEGVERGRHPEPPLPSPAVRAASTVSRSPTMPA